jgi:acetyl esterase/lipase
VIKQRGPLLRHERAASEGARRLLLVLSLVFFAAAPDLRAQARVDRNLVYGMYSGLALLMDVHRPETANGYGVLFIAGSAWSAPLTYRASNLKDAQIGDWAPSLLGAGYTVFAVNHRSTPRFHYPEPVEDIQRAIRFIRHNAKQFGIEPERLGGIGGSSGGHLVGLVAMLNAPGIADDPDPINRQPATLQCVVLRATPSDLAKMIGANGLASAAVAAFVNRLPTPNADDQKAYRAASPITHVAATSPPVLLLHGDADDTVPYDQSVAMEAALRGVNVPVKLIRVAGGAHGSDFGMGGKPHPHLPDVLRDTVAWFNQYLRTPR